MNRQITGVFPDEALAFVAATELTRMGFNVLDKPTHLPLAINRGDITHHRNMIAFGLLGTVIGYFVGLFLVPLIPGREVMFTLIVPVTLTYAGLAFGFFCAGVRKRILELLNVSPIEHTSLLAHAALPTVSVQPGSQDEFSVVRGVLAHHGAKRLEVVHVEAPVAGEPKGEVAEFPALSLSA